MWWVVIRIEWEENFEINYYKHKVDIVKICPSYDNARLVTENDASFYKTVNGFKWHGDRSYCGEIKEKPSGFTKGVEYEIRQTE